MTRRIITARDQVALLDPWRTAATRWDAYDDDMTPDKSMPLKQPTGSEWYHVSPHKLSPGTMLVPSSDEDGFCNHHDEFYDGGGIQSRKNWVWLENQLPKSQYWNREIGRARNPDGGEYNEDTGEFEYDYDNAAPNYVYKVTPHHDPFPWNGFGNEGWVAQSAIVDELVDDAHPTEMSKHLARRMR